VNENSSLADSSKLEGYCPVCLLAHRYDAQSTSEVRCDCGAALFVTAKGRLATKVGPQDVAVSSSSTAVDSAAKVSILAESVLDIKTDKAAKSRAEPSKSSDEPKRKRSLLTPIGGGFVAMLLLFSMVLFFRRNMPNHASPIEPTSITESATVEVKEIASAVIPAGTFARLAALAPDPAASDTRAMDLQNDADAQEVIKSKSSTNTSATKPSAKQSQTIAPALSLPAATKARPQIPYLSVDVREQVFGNIHDQVYESYEALMAVDKSDLDTESYRLQMAETLALTKKAYALALRSGNAEQRDELLCLLTFLSFKGGHLMEAAVYGEAVIRLGEASKDSTHDSALMALAAAQEASSIHWGNPSAVGELHQMRTIAELIETKWPDDSQRDTIWISLAQRFAAFGQLDESVEAFKKIKPKSADFADAQLGIGSAYWLVSLDDTSAGKPKSRENLSRLKLASKHFEAGVVAKEERESKPDLPLLTAKLTLAKLAKRLDDPKAIKHWLTGGKFPLIESLATSARHQPKQIVVTVDFAKIAFDVFYQSMIDDNDAAGAAQALDFLDKVVGRTEAGEVKSMVLSSLKQQFRQLLDQHSANEEEIKILDNLHAMVTTQQSSMHFNEMLWIAKSWADIAKISSSDSLAATCYQQAAKTCTIAMELKSFPEASRLATKRQQAEWLRLAGKKEGSLAILVERLKLEPNVIDLQMLASQNLEDIAIANDSVSELQNALNGPAEKDESSPIWGWAKLTATLHNLRHSDRGNEIHARLLLQSHFHMARCRWMLANVTTDDAERTTLVNKIRIQTTSLGLFTDQTDANLQSWQDAFSRLKIAGSSSEVL